MKNVHLVFPKKVLPVISEVRLEFDD